MAQPEITLYWFPISHPAQAVKRMLEYKGLEFGKVTIPAGLQPLAMRAYGFAGPTVPGLKVDGEKVQGSTAISRRLEEIKPDPPLFGETDEDREEIENAEHWGERELQPVPRRVFRWLGAHRAHVRSASARVVGAPAPLAGPVGLSLIVPFRLLARIGDASEKTVRSHLADLPGNLDHVDELLAENVIGGARPNAADFQIASSVHAILSMADLRPYVEGRPCEAYALEFMDGPPRNQLPGGLPADWLPADSRQSASHR